MHALALSQTSGELTAVQAITEDLRRRFIDYIDAKPQTIATYSRALRQLIGYLSTNGISQPTRGDILAYRDHLRQNYKPTTVQGYITASRLFFQWLEQEGLYQNVASKIKGAKLEKGHRKEALSSQQMKAVQDAVGRDSLQGLRDYAIITAMVTGALRTIEVARANIEDIREAGGQRRLYIQGKGRDGKQEFIILTAEVSTAINEYLEARQAGDPSQPLFAITSNNSRGGRLSTRSISGIVKQWLRKAGYDSDMLTAHSLRHTAITLALKAGQLPRAVQQFARINSPIVMETYAHDMDRAENKCEEAIALAIF